MHTSRYGAGPFYLYVVTCSVTGKEYVGITSQTVAARWRGHLRDALNGSTFYFHSAIRKYGADKFHVSTIGSARSWAAIVRREQREIATRKTFGAGGYNLTAGGEGSFGTTPTRRTRKIISSNQTRLWSDPGFRQTQCAAMKRKYAEPAMRAKLRLIQNDPKIKARRVATLKRTIANNPRLRTVMAERMKIRQSDPVFRAAMIAANKSAWIDPKRRRQRIAAISCTRGTTQSRALTGSISARRWRNPEYKERLSATHLRGWADPAIRARRIAGMRKFYESKRAA